MVVSTAIVVARMIVFFEDRFIIPPPRAIYILTILCARSKDRIDILYEVIISKGKPWKQMIVHSSTS
jgi:hypothetical protein